MSVDLSSKTCTKCRLSKSTSEFHKRSLSFDGLMSQCKNCVNARIKANYDRNPKNKIVKTREYHLSNPEWSRKTQAKWHQKNKVTRYQRVQERLATDAEFLTYRRKIQAAAERKRRALKTSTSVEHITLAQYEAVLTGHNNACWICEQTLSTAPAWDHVHPLAKGGAHVISNLLPACTECNGRKSDKWPFTNEMKEAIATEVRALRTPQEHTILASDGMEVSANVWD